MKNEPPAGIDSPMTTHASFYAYAAFILHHRKIVIAAAFLVSMALSAGIGNLRVQVDPNADLPQDHPYVMATNEIESRFAGRNLVVVGIESLKGDIFQPQIVEVVKDVTRRIEQLPGVVRHRLQSIASSRTKDIRGTQEGMRVVRMLDGGTVPPEELRERLFANPIYVDSLVSNDGKVAFVLADFKRIAEHGGYRGILERVENELNKAKTDDVRFHLGGLTINLAWLEIYSQSMQYLFLVVLAVVMVISYLSFGTLQATFIPMLTGIVSVLWTLGVMGWFNIPMDTYNVATPVLIMTVAHGHSVQILKRFYEELPRSVGVTEAVCQTIAAVGSVMLTASSIAILSFLALLTFPLKTIQIFGAMAATGIAAALVLEMTFIPALRASLGPRKALAGRTMCIQPLDVIANGASSAAVGRYSKVILVGTVCMMGIFLYGATQLRVDNSLKGNFFADSLVRTDDAFINAHSGGTNTLSILFESDTPDAMKRPEVLKSMEEIQARLQKAFPAIGKTQSIVDLVKKMHLSMHGGDDSSYKFLPENQELIAQYLLLYSMSGDPEDLSLYIDYDYRSAVVWAYMKTDSSAYVERVVRSVREWSTELLPPDIEIKIGGSVAESTALNEVMVSGKVANLVVIGTIVLVLSAFVLRSLVAGMFVLLPLLVTVLVNFGIMGLTGMRLDVATATISALAVGVGADYAVYLIARIREELWHSPVDVALRKAVQTAGKAVISVAGAVGGGYAVLLLSEFNAHVRLGGLVGLSMLVSGITCVCLLPALISVIRPSCLQQVARPPSTTLATYPVLLTGKRSHETT